MPLNRKCGGLAAEHEAAPSTISAELRKYIQGWKAYFQLAEVTSPLRDIDKWIRRRLRSYHWKQWGRRGYRELRKRGVEYLQVRPWALATQ